MRGKLASLPFFQGRNILICIFHGKIGWRVLVTYLSSLSPMRHKSSTICRHLPLSFVTYWAWPIEKPISSSSDVIDLLHVVLGLTLFLLPGGVQCKVTLDILIGCHSYHMSSHLIRLCFISTTMFLLFLGRVSA